MSKKKKNKFDLTNMVRAGILAEAETLFFISNPALSCVIKKMPNHEFKLEVGEEIMTLHQTAVKFLGTEPPDLACRWLRNEGGKTLYELWQDSLADEEAA